MTGEEIWGLDNGWKERGKVHGLFYRREIGMQETPFRHEEGTA